MCTLLHRPRILFLDEPATGVAPLSRRDFWAILYGLVKEGMTILLTTAYMDEAERCNRVGLMHNGCLIRCDEPEAIRKRPDEECYEVQALDLREARKALLACKGVLSVEPSGSSLHLFLDPETTSPEKLDRALTEQGLGPVTPLTPSIEDVFIALIHRMRDPTPPPDPLFGRAHIGRRSPRTEGVLGPSTGFWPRGIRSSYPPTTWTRQSIATASSSCTGEDHRPGDPVIPEGLLYGSHPPLPRYIIPPGEHEGDRGA